MNKLFYTIVLTATVLLGMGLSGCSPEIVLARNLEGDWDVKSYTVDGEETIGFTITSFTIEFEEYDGDEGDFDLNIISANGGSSRGTGEYSINADGTEIDLDYDSGTSLEFDIELDGDDLELSGNFDGVREVIVAERD